MKDPKRVLIDEALRIISDPLKWHTGCSYKDDTGFKTNARENAYSFCAFGALLHVQERDSLPQSSRYDILEDFEKKYGDSIPKVNDEDGRQAVISKLKGLYDE